MLGHPDTGGNTAAVQAPSPTTAQAAANNASPNLSNQLAYLLQGEYGAQEAQYGLASSLGQAQMGLSADQLAVTSAEQTNQAQYSLANALLGYEGVGLQSQALASQAQTQAAQQGIEQSQYGVQSTQYPEQQAQAKQQFEVAQQQAQDQGAASGVLGTQGQKSREAVLQSNYGWQQADIFRNQQLAQLGQQSEQTGYAGQEEQVANQKQQLALAAQAQGLTAQQAMDQLSFGLQQSGVQAEPEQYLATIANAQGQGAQSLAALGSQASLIGGLGPNFLSGG